MKNGVDVRVNFCSPATCFRGRKGKQQIRELRSYKDTVDASTVNSMEPKTSRGSERQKFSSVFQTRGYGTTSRERLVSWGGVGRGEWTPRGFRCSDKRKATRFGRRWRLADLMFLVAIFPQWSAIKIWQLLTVQNCWVLAIVSVYGSVQPKSHRTFQGGG